MNSQNLTDQELVRREKMNALREKGIDPFGKAFKRTTNSLELKTTYQDNTKEELLEMNVRASVAGRIMTKRSKGKAGFMHIQDKFGLLQIYVRSDHLSEEEFLPKLKEMINFGIKGLECYYSRYSLKEAEFLAKCAKENNLLISGGSDYHGSNKSNIKIGQLCVENKEIDSNKLNILKFI